MNIIQVSGGEIRIPAKTGGGVEAFILSISKQLSKSGHEVTILDRRYSPTDKDNEQIDGVNIVRLKAIRFKKFNYTINYIVNQVVFALQIKKYLKQTTNIDIIHVHSSILGFVLVVGNRKLKHKLVYGSYGLRGTKQSPSLVDRLALTLENQLTKRVKKVTIENEILGAELAKKAKRRAQDIVTVPLGVDIELFNPNIDVGDIRQRFGFEGKVTILFVGRVCADKGIEYLVKAANILVNGFGYKHVRFLIVGPVEQFDSVKVRSSPYLIKILRFIEDHGLKQNVQLTGALFLDDLRKLYVACDIFVVPSIVDLGPQVQLEAMACGKPVIGTKVGTMPVWIKNEQSGFLVDSTNERQLADRLKYLIDKPTEAKRMGTYGRKLAEEEFASCKTAERLLQVYQSD